MLAALRTTNWISHVLEFALRVVEKLYVPISPPKNTLLSDHPADADDIATSWLEPPVAPVCTTVPDTTNVSPDTSPLTCCLNFPDTPVLPVRVILFALAWKVPDPASIKSQ